MNYSIRKVKVRSVLNIIIQNRLLQTPEEIGAFEQALKDLISVADVSSIRDLCKGFDDDTEAHEVMFGLVHCVEQLYTEDVEEGLKLIALAVPEVLDRAREWMEILHYRLLNHPQVLLVYGRVLSKMDVHTKKVIIDLLNEIKNEDPHLFGNAVNEVLKTV